MDEIFLKRPRAIAVELEPGSVFERINTGLPFYHFFLGYRLLAITFVRGSVYALFRSECKGIRKN